MIDINEKTGRVQRWKCPHIWQNFAFLIFYLFQARSDTPSVKHFSKKLFTLQANLFLYN